MLRFSQKYICEGELSQTTLMLEEKFASEWYLTAEEAVELGVADKIIDDIDEIL